VVVAELLRTNPDLELIDAREYIPNFKARPGLTSWLVLDDNYVQGAKGNKKARLNAAGDSASTTKDAEGALDETSAAEDGAASAEPSGEGQSDKPVLFGLARCLNMGMRQYMTHDEVPDHHKQRIRKYVFPPTAKEVASMHLGRQAAAVI
jgi:hypothetical protein